MRYGLIETLQNTEVFLQLHRVHKINKKCNKAQLAGQPPTPGDLERLPYLEKVVKEVLRIYSPAASLSRIAREPFEWKGYAFHVGDIIMYSPYVSHRMLEQFADPDVFRPERFDPVHGEKHLSGAYLPFGAGPRIGASLAPKLISTVLPANSQK